MSYVIHVHPQYGYHSSGYGHRSYGGYGGYSSYGLGSMSLVGDGGYSDHGGYPRVGSDGLTTQQREFLRRSRRAVARQTYLANASLRSALIQSDMTINSGPALSAARFGLGGYGSYGGYSGYGQAMVGGYGAAAYTPYAGAYAYPGYAYAGVNSLAAYQPVVPFWG